MADNFPCGDRDQRFSLPTNLHDWLPADQLGESRLEAAQGGDLLLINHRRHGRSARAG